MALFTCIVPELFKYIYIDWLCYYSCPMHPHCDLPLVSGHHKSALPLHGFAYSGYFLEVESSICDFQCVAPFTSRDLFQFHHCWALLLRCLLPGHLKVENQGVQKLTVWWLVTALPSASLCSCVKRGKIPSLIGPFAKWLACAKRSVTISNCHPTWWICRTWSN